MYVIQYSGIKVIRFEFTRYKTSSILSAAHAKSIKSSAETLRMWFGLIFFVLRVVALSCSSSSSDCDWDFSAVWAIMSLFLPLCDMLPSSSPSFDGSNAAWAQEMLVYFEFMYFFFKHYGTVHGERKKMQLTSTDALFLASTINCRSKKLAASRASLVTLWFGRCPNSNFFVRSVDITVSSFAIFLFAPLVLIAGEKLRFGWSHGGYFAVVICYKRVPHTDNDSGLPNTCSNLKKPRFSSTVSSFTDMMRNYWREQIEFKCIALIDPIKQFTVPYSSSIDAFCESLFVVWCVFSCHF